MTTTTAAYLGPRQSRVTIYLAGLPGSGKTTVAKRVAAMTGIGFYDTDIHIAENVGMHKDDIAEVWRRVGAKSFRRAECSSVVALTHAGRRPKIIATGGGAMASDKTRGIMLASGTVVWLNNAGIGDLAARVAGSTRPMFEDLDVERSALKLRRLLREHRRAYAEAHVEITYPRDIAGAAARIAKLVEKLIGRNSG